MRFVLSFTRCWISSWILDLIIWFRFGNNWKSMKVHNESSTRCLKNERIDRWVKYNLIIQLIKVNNEAIWKMLENFQSLLFSILSFQYSALCTIHLLFFRSTTWIWIRYQWETALGCSCVSNIMNFHAFALNTFIWCHYSTHIFLLNCQMLCGGKWVTKSEARQQPSSRMKNIEFTNNHEKP